MKKKRRLSWSAILLILGCVVGLSMLLYPSFADYWNSRVSMVAITDYEKTVETLDESEYEEIWQAARTYNEILYHGSGGTEYSLADHYDECLNVSGVGLMGYVEIPKIKVMLPLYHGVSDSVLQIAAGHLEWTSLPVGGENTHCALSGHRGLLSAKLFTDLDQLREGDEFMLNILDETLTYQVDQIRIVEPEDTSDLAIEEGKDYCTLVTCTPYGINTHRMLVRGHRVETKIGVHIVSEAVLVDQLIVASFLALPVLFALLMVVLFKKPKPQKPKVTYSDLFTDDGGKKV